MCRIRIRASNARVGDGSEVGVMGECGVPGVYKSGERLIFKKDVQEFTWVKILW